MKIEDFIDKLYFEAEKSSLEEFEIYYSSGKSFSVKIFNGEIDSYKNAKGLGVSLRGIFNEKMGYSYTTKIEESSVNKLVEEVIANAKILENSDKVEIFSGSPSYKKVENYKEEFDTLTVEKKINFTKDMEVYAKSLDSRVVAVNACVFQNGEGERVIRNSKGLYLTSKKNSGISYISVVVKENESNKTAFEFISGNDFAEYDYKKLAKSAVEKAVSKLSSQPLKTGKYSVVFENSAFCELLGAFTGIFSAEAVDKGVSLLKNKIGQEVANNKVTLVDDPFCELAHSTVAFDDEGVATNTKKLIDKGVLKTYLHNLKTAEKFKTSSTGNGFKGSYAGTINIGPTNLYLEKGEKTFSELVKTFKNVVVITDLAGLHSGLNTISGDFSLSAEGYYYENGEKSYPVNGITVAGNFFKLLKEIHEIGSDFKFGMGSVGSASILVEELNIAGK
ncbi:MAG: TldD/PmbA family protein [Fusobacteriaceae bacterium]